MPRMTDVAARLFDDLPDALFASIAHYLACPSRAAFAVALEGLSGPRAAVVASCAWSTLDFGEIEQSLASKLSDDDISAMLMAIDAVNNVKTLKLTGCSAITGSGLAPLAGSTALKTIDLVTGLDEGDNKFSSDVAVPIVRSIIDAWTREMSAVERYLDIPSIWSAEIEIGSSVMGQLLRRYHPILNEVDVTPRPKQTRNSHILYCEANREQIKAAHPNVAVREKEQLLTANYLLQGDEERKYWNKKAKEDAHRYVDELMDYEARKRLKFSH